MTEKLMVCPFCGYETKIMRCNGGLYQCLCPNCGCEHIMFFDSPEEAALDLNNRPIENSRAAEIARLRGNIEAIKKNC